MFTIPTSTASTLLASVGDVVSDPGMLAILAVVLGVPFAFYVIKKVKALIPK
jgi:hypothetical protein